MWSDSTNELITTCPFVMGVAARFLGFVPTPAGGGVVIALGAWRTHLLEPEEPSVAYPFDMVVSNLLVVGGMSIVGQ